MSAETEAVTLDKIRRDYRNAVDATPDTPLWRARMMRLLLDLQVFLDEEQHPYTPLALDQGASGPLAGKACIHAPLPGHRIEFTGSHKPRRLNLKDALAEVWKSIEPILQRLEMPKECAHFLVRQGRTILYLVHYCTEEEAAEASVRLSEPLQKSDTHVRHQPYPLCPGCGIELKERGKCWDCTLQELPEEERATRIRLRQAGEKAILEWSESMLSIKAEYDAYLQERAGESP